MTMWAALTGTALGVAIAGLVVVAVRTTHKVSIRIALMAGAAACAAISFMVTGTLQSHEVPGQSPSVVFNGFLLGGILAVVFVAPTVRRRHAPPRR